MTGTYQRPQRRPSKAAAERARSFSRIFGKAKPNQPISSKNPAGIPSSTPIQNRLGVQTGDTKDFKNRRRPRTRAAPSSSPLQWKCGQARLPVRSVGQGHFREVEGGLDGGFAGFAEELDVFLVGGEDGIAGGGLLCKVENDGGDGARVFG